MRASEYSKSLCTPQDVRRDHFIEPIYRIDKLFYVYVGQGISYVEMKKSAHSTKDLCGLSAFLAQIHRERRAETHSNSNFERKGLVIDARNFFF
jgi:hypothetical protein